MQKCPARHGAVLTSARHYGIPSDVTGATTVWDSKEVEGSMEWETKRASHDSEVMVAASATPKRNSPHERFGPQIGSACYRS